MSELRTSLTAPLRSEDRWLAALALAVTAATHAPLIPMHLEEAPYVGWLFIVLTAVSAALAVLMVVVDSRAVWLATGVTAALAVVAFVLSRTVGLPQIADDIGNWTEPLSYPAVVAEAIAAVVSVAVLRRRTAARRPGPAAAHPAA